MSEIEKHIKHLSKKIYLESDKRFDIRNLDGYIFPKQKFKSIIDLAKSSNFDFEDFISNETRKSYRELLIKLSPDKGNNQVSDNKFDYIGNDERDLFKELLQQEALSRILRDKIKNELTRDILFFGSECEEQGVINIQQEFKDLEKEVENEYLKLHKADSQTLEGLRSSWDKTEPEIIILSCHGEEYSLILKDENGKCKEYKHFDFVQFFKRRSNHTECVILSSCLSEKLGEKIAHDGRNVVCISKKVLITEAAKYKKKFFRYLNNHSLDNDEVYRKAHEYSKEGLEFDDSPDSFSFKFINPTKY